MMSEGSHPRLARLPKAPALGSRYPVAAGFRSRLLGLALIDRRQAGPGLLLPRCRSIHTFGMRFRIDVLFLDRDGHEIRRAPAVPPGRLVGDRRASAVLELPAPLTPSGG